MIIHPDIAALRSSPASQRSTREAIQAALGEWFAHAETSAVRSDLVKFAAGADLDALDGLGSLLGCHGEAQKFVQILAAHFVAAMRDAPLGEAPFQHRSSEGFSRLQLMREGGAVLSLCTYDRAPTLAEPEHARFADCEAHEIVIAGKAQCLCHRLGENSELTTRRTDLRAGERIVRRPRRDARQIVAVERPLSVLQLTRTRPRPGPTCEHRLSDGMLVQQSSGDRQASEDVMALGVLGALGEERALPQMREVALDAFRDRDVRWEAVRQVIAMDARAGIALLTELGPPDPLAVPAKALRDQLCASHPMLRELITGTV